MNAQDDQVPIDWKPLQRLLEQHHRFVLTSHVRPDCDALGSELAMAGLLDALGKHVRIVNADPTPPRLSFLDPHQRIEVLDQGVSRQELDLCDVMLVLDTGAWGQLGAMADVVRASNAAIVVIDHHASDGELAATFFKDPTAEATGRLVFELARYLDLPLGPQIAMPLFAAIATDTGWFRFPSTRSGTYRVAAALIEAGAVPHDVFRQLYECDSLARTKLRARVLDRITAELEGRLVHSFVRVEDFAQTGAKPSETEDFVNLALNVAGSEVALLMTEQPREAVRVNFRSRSAIDCSQLAGQFQGGGHRAAAGATVAGDFEQVRTRVLHAVRTAMTNVPHDPRGVADKGSGSS